MKGCLLCLLLLFCNDNTLFACSPIREAITKHNYSDYLVEGEIIGYAKGIFKFQKRNEETWGYLIKVSDVTHSPIPVDTVKVFTFDTDGGCGPVASSYEKIQKRLSIGTNVLVVAGNSDLLSGNSDSLPQLDSYWLYRGIWNKEKLGGYIPFTFQVKASLLALAKSTDDITRTDYRVYTIFHSLYPSPLLGPLRWHFKVEHLIYLKRHHEIMREEYVGNWGDWAHRRIVDQYVTSIEERSFLDEALRSSGLKGLLQ